MNPNCIHCDVYKGCGHPNITKVMGIFKHGCRLPVRDCSLQVKHSFVKPTTVPPPVPAQHFEVSFK